VPRCPRSRTLRASERCHEISISPFLEVGLDYEVDSESIDSRQYIAPGGQLDLARRLIPRQTLIVAETGRGGSARKNFS